MRTRPLQAGEPAPWFVSRSSVSPEFHFDSMAGRKVVMCFFGSANDAASKRILDDLLAYRKQLDDENVRFFGVSIDRQDERMRLNESFPGFCFLWDSNLRVSRLFRALDVAEEGTSVVGFRRFTLVLDERLRVYASVPWSSQPELHAPQVVESLASLPQLGDGAPAVPQAPVLVVPRVFEPQLCQDLIRYYQEHGGRESGFMRDVNGITVAVQDYAHKRRRDQEIADEQLRIACMHRIHDRLLPDILKAYQFRCTRIERYIVACYDSATGGHFRAHRDNTTRGTAHRRFAVSLNLNSGEYEGGDLRFPEFGSHAFRPPTGGAIVFSCSLLHEATPVTRGQRFVFLPFLYDDAAAAIREQNAGFVVTQRLDEQLATTDECHQQSR